MPDIIELDALGSFVANVIERVTNDKGHPCSTRWQFCTVQNFLILVIESTDKEVETYTLFTLNKILFKNTGYRLSNRFTISPGIEPDYGIAEWEVFGQQVTISDLRLPNRKSKKRGFADWTEFVSYASYGIEQINSDWEVHQCSAVPELTESNTRKSLLAIGGDLLKRWTKKTSTLTSSPSSTDSQEETGQR